MPNNSPPDVVYLRPACPSRRPTLPSFAALVVARAPSRTEIEAVVEDLPLRSFQLNSRIQFRSHASIWSPEAESDE